MQTDNQKQIIRIYIPTLTSQGKMLTKQIDPEDPDDVQTASLIKEVAASEPQSIQDFFMRLNALIHKKNKVQ
jgi:hypothetical protein